MAGEQVDDPALDRLGREPGRAEQRIGHGSVLRPLELVHPLVHLHEPPVAAAHADGERQEHQPEPVAELARDRLIERAQVERHHRLDLGDRAAAVLKVVAQATADGGQQDVVDGGVVGVGDVLDPRQRQSACSKRRGG